MHHVPLILSLFSHHLFIYLTFNKFGTSKLAIAQYLVADGTAIKVENTKIKKKSCPAMFKAISNLSTVTTYVEKELEGERGAGNNLLAAGCHLSLVD